MAARIRYLVEEARFFEHSWLVRGRAARTWTATPRCSASTALAEAVSLVLEHEGSSRARATATTTGRRRAGAPDRDAASATSSRRGRCPTARANGGRALLHSQSGIDSDVGRHRGLPDPGGRRARRCSEHLRTVRPNHALFPAGISDVLAFDDTARRNPDAVVDVHPRRLPHRDARRHLQPRQQRLHPDHRLPGAQVRPRQDRSTARGTTARSSAPARSPSRTSTVGRRSGVMSR